MIQNENNKPVSKEVLQVDRELIENISRLIDDQASDSIINIFADVHHADIAEILNHLDTKTAEYAFKLLDNETAGDVLLELDENLRDKILEDIDAGKITDIVDELDSDDATDIVSNLPLNLAEHVLENIDIEDSFEVKQLLKYPEDTAGGLMSSDFVFVSEGSTIKDAIRQVRKHAEDFEYIYHIYILAKNHTLIGVVSLKHLLITSPKTPITNVMTEDLIYVSPMTDQEEVAEVMKKYDLVAIPVVDDEKKMLGRITIDDVVDVMDEEAEEDISKIAGLSDEQGTTDSVFKISRLRLPWLVIALILEFFSAIILSSYQDLIQEFYVATFFIPVIMAIGGSSGTQAAIVMVRALGTRDIWLKENLRNLFKEFLVSSINGLICGSILMVGTILIFPAELVPIKFAAMLALALMIIVVFATMAGSSIPLLLKKMGSDPAIATGPFVTTTNDIIGLLIYLSLITLFMKVLH